MDIVNSLMEIVKTYDGTEAARKDCRFIKGGYYIKNKQCFLIDGKWYRINSGKVAFDHEHSDWIVLGTRRLIEGIVDFKNNTPVFGSFSPNMNKNTHIYYKHKYFDIIDEKIVLGSDMCIEGVNGGYYFKDEPNLPKEFTTRLRPHREDYYSFPYNYGSDSLIPEFRDAFEESFVGDPLISDAWKHIADFSFGVEFETERGAIPERHLMRNGLIACRDGSITGFEYTTIPLRGESGIQAVRRACDLLKKYCACSPNESMHIHIGEYPRTVKAITALYRLGILVQREIYSMFPPYYTDTAKFKRKGYCNPLYAAGAESDDPKKIMSDIYFYLSNGSSFLRFPTGMHPMDRSGQHKWEISPRYHWLNLIPIIWGERGTVEFRCHTPTVNADKVINWLFIIIAIMKYALKHGKELIGVPQSELKPVSLTEILTEVYPKHIASILIDYIDRRKSHYSTGIDKIGEQEIVSEELGVEVIKTNRFV